MDKLYVVLSTVFVHILFLLVEAGVLISLYSAARGDRSCLIITALCVLARQCLKGLWYFTQKEFNELKEGRDAENGTRSDKLSVRKVTGSK